ncbi:MAG TPA: hypothetical protein VGN32_20500, partial [Ktedonobacterales bacterium]|nr:hypothetical protein [Ktedonobacterales bacterium]
MNHQASGSSFRPLGAAPLQETPLVVVFERDDAIAVPLLTQLRMATYDVRSARTPVELFDTLQKHVVALILVDLGNATASRREFWVALDAHRRGHATQVLTFRQVAPGGPLDSELEVSPMALADVEIAGARDLPVLLEAIRQRVPLGGSTPADSVGTVVAGMGGLAGLAPLGPFGPVLGVPVARGFGTPLDARGSIDLPLAPGSPPSPFAHPAPENPFAVPAGASPFAQPDASNPFASLANETQAPARHTPSTAFDPGRGPHKSPATGGLAATRLEPFNGTHDAPGMPFAPVMRGAPDPGAAANNGHTSGALASHSAAARHDDAPAAVADAWIPPDGDDLFARPTSPPDQAASERTAGAMSGRAAPEWPTQPVIVPADRDFPTYDTWTPHDETSSSGDLTANAPFERSTAPVPAAAPTAAPSTQLPVVSGGLTRPEERALGAVLVEGALISPRKLEVLKGIQRMLTTVEMDFKLGELALLFKFL